MSGGMGGAHGRFGGHLSGGMRCRLALRSVVPVRDVAPAPRPVRTTGAPAPADGDAAYALASRAFAEKDDAIAALAAVTARLKDAQKENRLLERRLAETGDLRDSFASVPTRASQHEAERAPAPARVRASTPADREMITGVKRSGSLIVKPKATYGNYDMDDIYELGQRIKAGTLTLAQIRHTPDDFRVPYGTMRRWVKPREDGTPAWLYERDVKRRTKKPRAGAEPLLGKLVESKLMVDISDAARSHCPYLADEVATMVRNTLIETKAVVPKTGDPYTSMTDVSTLVKGFIARCAEAGVHILEKHGRKLGLQRHINQNYDALTAYAAKVNPALIDFQKKHGVKLTLWDVGNWDETGLDLCAFAKGVYLFLKGGGNQVVVPFEQSPHWTLVVGFVGKQKMKMLAIMKGVSNQSPSPYHAQLLSDDDGTYLGQSETGWITAELKLAFFKLQLDAGIIGRRPLCINVDGHGSNFDNEPLEKLALENKVILLIPPSHTSATVDGMGTQQGDRPAHQGGPIALLKREIRSMVRQQFSAKLRHATRGGRAVITPAEILSIVAQCWTKSYNPSLISSLNADVGYYINSDGYLQYDLTRLLPVPAERARAPAPSAAEPQPHLAQPPASLGRPPAAFGFASGAAADAQAAADAAAAALQALGSQSAASAALAPTTSTAPAPAPVVSHRFGREYYNMLHVSQAVVIEDHRNQVERLFALERARKGLEQPVVQRPTEPIRRDAESKRSNKYGCIVGSEEHRAAVSSAKAGEAGAAQKKLDAEAAKWSKYCAVVLAVETALVDKGGDLKALQVSELKALVLSRTGHWPKAKNNKDGALLAEAVAAASAQPATLMPAMPAAAAAASVGDVGGSADDALADGALGVWACETCCEEFAATSLPQRDENGHYWCTCDGRITCAD
jgi:hypothetical protein